MDITMGIWIIIGVTKMQVDDYENGGLYQQECWQTMVDWATYIIYIYIQPKLFYNGNS